LETPVKVHFWLLSVAVIYAANYIIAKSLMPTHFSPEGLIAVRVAMSTLLFWLVSLFYGRKEPLPKLRQHILLMRCAVTGVMINQLFFFKGLALTSTSHASLIMTATPILVLILSAFILRQRPGPQQWVGIILGFIGAAWLVFQGSSGKTADQSSVLGDVYILINALSYGLYLVWVKPLMSELSPMNITKWIFLYASPFLIFWGWNDVNDVNWGGIGLLDWMALAYVILFTTGLAYGLNALAIQNASPELVGSYIYLQPLLAIVISISLGLDQLGFSSFTAGVLILLGVWLVSTRKKLFKLTR
jgi:drug/metabolite transporter (DMT)-like permease